MSKISKWFPSYRLGNPNPKSTRMPGAMFEHQGTTFTTDFPMFGVTETQKAALRWAWDKKTPPVVSISHEKPITHIDDVWSNPEDLHQTYYPYAMAIATIECLGEEQSRTVRVYFCNVVYHIDNFHSNIHSEGKNTRVVPF